MKIHADLSQRAVVFSRDLPWIESPMTGVQRRMIERDGGEIARATSIVRYEPGSSFSAHIHGGGEEFFVLEGIFSDEWGDYEVGTYVRNPVGSRHTPYTREGCTILVKLWQIAPEDQNRIVIKTTDRAWCPSGVDGLSIVPLHQFGSERVDLLNLAPGATLPPHHQPGGEEIFVLEGVLEDEHGVYPQGTWLRLPSGSQHRLFSPQGCQLYRKVGHLP